MTRFRISLARLAKMSIAKKICLIMISAGISTLVLSVIYEYQILAFLGLGLLFWGIVFTYVGTDEYTKRTLLDVATLSHTELVNEVFRDLDYKGSPIYLPPDYFTNPETQKVFVPKPAGVIVPKKEYIQTQEHKMFLSDPSGALFTPVGAELEKAFEKILGKNFTAVDLKYLQNALPNVMVDDLEIASNCYIKNEGNTINVDLRNCKYHISSTELADSSSRNENIYIDMNPISALACSFARATGKPIIIRKYHNEEKAKQLLVDFLIIDKRSYE